MRVLVSHASPAQRREVVELLHALSLEAVEAAGGDEALQVLSADDGPRVALIDQALPGLDGVELCRQVRALRLAIRPHLILLTGGAAKTDVVQALKAGADDSLPGLPEVGELHARLQVGLRNVQLQQDLQVQLSALDATLRRLDVVSVVASGRPPQPSVVAPSVVEPSVVEPSVVAPSVVEPNVVAPSVVEPNVVAPSVVEPNVVAPSVVEPSVVAPSVVEPNVVAPNVVAPSFVAPSGSTLGPELWALEALRCLPARFESVVGRLEEGVSDRRRELWGHVSLGLPNQEAWLDLCFASSRERLRSAQRGVATQPLSSDQGLLDTLCDALEQVLKGVVEQLEQQGVPFVRPLPVRGWVGAAREQAERRFEFEHSGCRLTLAQTRAPRQTLAFSALTPGQVLLQPLRPLSLPDIEVLARGTLLRPAYLHRARRFFEGAAAATPVEVMLASPMTVAQVEEYDTQP